jgi:hypothetical protein
LLAKTSADHVIAEAGSLDLDDLASTAKSIKTVIWVTRSTNEHMNWTEGRPDGYTVTSWHELVEKNRRSAKSEVLPLDKDSQVPPVSIFVPTTNGGYDLVKYTSEVSYLIVPSSRLWLDPPRIRCQLSFRTSSPRPQRFSQPSHEPTSSPQPTLSSPPHP